MCLVGQRRLLAPYLKRPEAKTIELEALRKVPLYLSHRAHAIRALIEQSAQSRRVTLNILAEVDSLYIMKDLVMQGAGCCILSMANVVRELEHRDLLIVRIVKPAIPRRICLVRRQGQVMPRAARELAVLSVRLLLELVRDDIWRARPALTAADIQILL